MAAPLYSMTLHAGPHDRRNCPVRLTLPQPPPGEHWLLVAGESHPLQRLNETEFAFIEPFLPAGTSRTYEIRRCITPPSGPADADARKATEAKAAQLGMGFVDLTLYKPDAAALKAIPEHVARNLNVAPLKKEDGVLYVALADTDDRHTADVLRLVSHCQVRGVLAVSEHIAEAIPCLYGESHGITLSHEDGKAITVSADGALITRYVYGDVPARPYFFPLRTVSGVGVTRSYPMHTDVPDETHDHPHHKSVWIAHGEVNGADNWSEEKGHGHTRHRSLDILDNGPVCGRFATTSEWTDVNDKPLLTQHLTVTFWGKSGHARLIDFDIRLEATHGDVHFGDTKEGGILSVRVASALDVPRGGRIENVYGGIGEGDTWGKAAHWCDYSGTVDGKHVGVAVLDHPFSFRYPTHWHVRDYGLMTANPFGYAAFTNGVNNGEHTLRGGDSLTFRYRMVLHDGDATEGHVNAHYLNFAAPPKVVVTESRKS